MITPKESLLIKNIIGHYMTSNNLYYDNNVEITRIMTKLKSIVSNDYNKEMTRKKAKFVLKKHYYERLAKNVCGVDNNNITLINKWGNKMSRKDYIQLARIIKDNTIINNNLFESISKKGFIDDLCDVLKQNNSKFDRLRFIDACND